MTKGNSVYACDIEVRAITAFKHRFRIVATEIFSIEET